MGVLVCSIPVGLKCEVGGGGRQTLRIFFCRRRQTSIREKPEAKNPTVFSSASSRSLGRDLVFYRGRCFRARQCGRWGKCRAGLDTVEPDNGIGHLQKCHPQGLQVRCRSSRHCSWLAHGTPIGQHAMPDRRSLRIAAKCHRGVCKSVRKLLGLVWTGNKDVHPNQVGW